MGKKKQAQRTKNNVVPASSGRSAELLQSTSSMPFVGFSTLKEGGFIPIISGLSDELDVNINEDFRLVWKKMNKKDTTTKLKALDEFKKLIADADVDTVKPVLPFWPRVYTGLATDEEHRVREAAHIAHRALAAKAGRNIAPFLKQLVGPWFTGQHDTYPPAASAAEISFQETFPLNKQVEAVVFCQEEILNYICNNLLEQTPQSLAKNQNSSQDVMDARFQRVIVGCLNGYALYLQRLPTEQLRKAEEANRKLVSSAKFWKFNKDSAPIVRAAWFTALIALCEKAPFLLAEESKHVCMAVFTNIDETDPTVVRNVWEAVLLSFTVVEDVWQHVSLEKLVLPKLWKILREGADGSASLVFPNLLPLLSKIPSSLLKDKTSFYSKFFENLRCGLKIRNIQIGVKETAAVVTTFLECLRYLITVNCEDEQLCLSLFHGQLFPLLEAALVDSKLQSCRTCLFSGVANLINSWYRSTSPSSDLFPALCTGFWSKLTLLSGMVLENTITDASVLANNCAAVQTLLVALKNPDYQPKKNFKVKFVSPKKSQSEEEEEISSLIPDTPCTSRVFEKERTKFILEHLNLSFTLLKCCSDKAKISLVSHLAHIVKEFENVELYNQILRMKELSWEDFYKYDLGNWLQDETIPLDYSLGLIFTFLKYVEHEQQVEVVYNDLSGERWQEVLEWALQHQSETVRGWIISHGGVCKLVTLLTRAHMSYNSLHKCLRNIRQNVWLTTKILTELLHNLRCNLTNPAISEAVKESSSDLLHAMLQNAVNHPVLAQLPAESLQMMLFELFTADLQNLHNFPRSWDNCLKILSIKSDSDHGLSAVCEKCVDLLVCVVRTREINLKESQRLLSFLEGLISVGGSASPSPVLTSAVLNRLFACLRKDSESVWGLYSLAERVKGNFRENCTLKREFKSPIAKDPLASVPLQEYITSMIPLMMMVVRLQTTQSEVLDSDSEASDGGKFPYSTLRSEVAPEDLWKWTFQALQLQSICISVANRFSSTKQYFLLREKISFIFEECGLFRQLDIKEVIKHLNLSVFEEGILIQGDTLAMLRNEVILKDLEILYGFQPLCRELKQYKDKIPFIKHQFYPEEYFEVVIKEELEKENLRAINLCCQRFIHLNPKAVSENHFIPISVLDMVFDKYVIEQKENRSFLNVSEKELLHISEVAEFTALSVRIGCTHMTQSAWDACLVATAALTMSLGTTLREWRDQLPDTVTKAISDTTTETRTNLETTEDQWPLSLLKESVAEKEQEEELLSITLVRVFCAVSRMFNAVSLYMKNLDKEKKEDATRLSEWMDVFQSGAHCSIMQAWLAVADLPLDRPTMLLLVEALSDSVDQFVVYSPIMFADDTLGCLDTCCRLLQSSEASTQLAAYSLIIRIIPAMLELDMKQCEKDNVALSCQLVDKVLVYTQSIIEVILSGLGFGDTCIVEPFTDSYSYVRCYLLLWSALLEMCANACSQLRALYTTWLKEQYLPMFMKTVFCLMPEAILHGDVPSQRITAYFSKPPELHGVVWSSDRLAKLSCRVYGCALRRLPAAIRQWWTESEHRISTLVEHVTATYVSSDLTVEEMKAIQTQERKFENMAVHVSPTAKEVYAVYTVEESRMELVIELAHNHPLGLVKVKSGQRMVSTAQTRQWLLQITIFLTHQNGSIWDALELWKTSLDKRFEGVEECYICFAILHSISHQLPKLSCQTCRKKFHSHCLYKWFTTSNKSTCPICRNLF